MPLLFRFELFDLKVAAESVGLPREKWLYRVACQRGKSRETKRVDYTGKVACPLPSCPFFKICTTQFFPPFHFSRCTGRMCVYVYACQGQDPVEENEGKNCSSSHRQRLLFLHDSWNTFTHVRYEAPSQEPFPKPTNLVFKIVFKFMRGTIPLLPTESLSVIGGTGARCLFAQLVVQTILLSPPSPVDICFFDLSTT